MIRVVCISSIIILKNQDGLLLGVLDVDGSKERFTVSCVQNTHAHIYIILVYMYSYEYGYGI